MLEKHYSSQPFIRHPKRLIHTLWQDLQDSRELAYRLFIRNLSAQYRHSLLGYFWAFVPPVVTALIWIVLQQTKIIDLPQSSEIPYPIYVLTGTILWRCFVDAVNMPLNSFKGAKYMLSKISFPHEALFLAGVANLLFNSLIRILILFVVLFFLGNSFSWTVLLFPFFLMGLLLLGGAIGLFLVPFGMIYDDVSRVLGLALQFLFYVTPVVYLLPQKCYIFNPIAPCLDITRGFLVGVAPMISTQFILIQVVNLAFFLFAWMLLKITMPHIIERISS
jgi:lipopolysaccharide transport system permease protein